jgi:uncharacterized protein (DUF58 family)
VTASSIDWPAVRAAARVRLAMPRTPLRGSAGERLGAGTGSSLEFEDYRPYTPGDDLRHVDWAAYARSEMLAVRLYREEVAPRLDLVIDLSRSMGVTAEKLRAHGELSGLLACACASTVADTRVVTRSAAEPHRLRVPEDLDRIFVCENTMSGLEDAYLPFRRRSVRIVVSDFLFPHDPDVLVSRLARDCAWLALIQLTLPEEAEPVPEGGRRLVDVEGRGELDVVMDDALIRDYRDRFARLRVGLTRAARRIGAPFAYLSSATPLREMARQLAAAGVVEAA